MSELNVTEQVAEPTMEEGVGVIGSETAAAEQPKVSFDIAEDAVLSKLANDEMTGFDPDKIRGLMSERDKLEESRNFFQGKYQQKANIPDDAAKYMEGFNPSDKYAGHMESEVAQNTIKSITEYAKQNNIGKDATQSFIDWTLQKQVESNIIDTRTEEQRAEALSQKKESAMQEVSPFLQKINRSYDENQEILGRFFKGNNPLVADEGMRDYLLNLADSSPEGYKLTTMLTKMVEGSSPPTVSGTIDKADLAEMRKELDKHVNDPEMMESVMNSYGYGEQEN